MTSGGELAGRLLVDGERADEVVLAQQRNRQQARGSPSAAEHPGGDPGTRPPGRCRASEPARGSRPCAPCCLPRAGSACAGTPRSPPGRGCRSRGSGTPRCPRRTPRPSSRRPPASWLARETIVLSTFSRSSVELRAWLTSPSACSSCDRAGELGGARLQLGEQPGVLDGDHRLVGEGLHQGDLTVGERPDLVPIDRDHAEQLAPAEHRDRQDGPDRIHLLHYMAVLRIGEHILDRVPYSGTDRGPCPRHSSGAGRQGSCRPELRSTRPRRCGSATTRSTCPSKR